MSTRNKHTWWGLQWIKILEHIDYYYLLRRGKSTASIKTVVSTSIYSNHIMARVQDTVRKSPYSVSIELPSLPEEQKVILSDKIKENNLLILRLLNKELPTEILQIIEELSLIHI